MKATIQFLGCVGILFAVSAARGATLTYVDATPDTGPDTGNTRVFDSIGGMPVLGIPEPNAGFNYTTTTNSGTDGLWHYRNLIDVNQVNGSFLWQTDGSGTVPNGETTEALVTSLTGLTPGEDYIVYVAFFSGQQLTGNWDIAARIGDTGQFTLFKHRGEPVPGDLTGFIDGGLGIDTTEDGSEFTNTDPAVITRAFSTTPAQGHLLLGSLGTVTIDGSGSVSVYIQGPDVDPDSSSGERRTYYEGLVYELAPQAGDFDGDGDVDGADFVVWQTNFPTAEGATLADGDADGDGDVDGADFVVWQTNFPTSPSPGIAPVPEPAGVILAVCCLLGSAASWRRRSQVAIR